ncbi:hypothetical protein ALC62_09194 [Cyphomyrmex costatus]|uniref:DNA-directed DNA polymerase n=1 Tax=Cyphomyrmex costatus TaxID=456900 RepID=A0A151IFS2_9HYME|nr:hypothetical protein ALC62_09194 [Cyphomyrmex costatus]
MERDFIEQATLLSTREEYVAWEQRCDEFIESLEEQSRIKRPRLSIGNRQSVIACIARLESLKDSVRGRFVHVGAGYGLRWREIETAFESRILTGAVINSNHIDPHRFLEDASEIVLERVQCIMRRYDSIKINTVFNGEFIAGEKRANKSIATRNFEIYRCTDQREWYVSRVVEPILASLEEFQERDSGWALSCILNLIVNANKLNPLRAGCHIKLSEEIISKRAVINVQSKDNACFAWSVVAALHPAESHGERESSYPHYSSVLNLTGIEFPMTLSQIKKFENLNDISINVYAIEEGIVPIRLADQKRSKHVNLLYVEDDIAGHFVLIKDLSRLVSSQISKKNNRKYFCDSSSSKLELHSTDCGKLNDCAIRLPSEDDKWLMFKNHCRKERVPFVVYADLECALEKTDKEPTSSTYTYQHHNVFSIGYYVYCSYDSSLSGYRFHRDNNSWFADELKNLAHSLQSVISTNVPMDFTRVDWRKFNSTTHCHVCEKPFMKDDKRARDHCHPTGRYRGPAHSNCNLNYKDSRCIPVIFHNLTGYDAHFIIKEIATAYEGRVDLLPITKEKYISFTKHVDDTIDDPSKQSSYLMYYNVNNLYGWAMCQPLPYADFRWIDDVQNFDFSTIALDSPTGYILEVDLEYPQHLHDAHTDLPFCPTREKPPGKRDEKLLATLRDKQRYVIHYHNLQKCTHHGLRIAKVHRKLQFTQSSWLRDYIELNTKFRTLAKNYFEKNLYKLMNNAVFGKTMENVRDRVDVKLLTKWEGK